MLSGIAIQARRQSERGKWLKQLFGQTQLCASMQNETACNKKQRLQGMMHHATTNFNRLSDTCTCAALRALVPSRVATLAAGLHLEGGSPDCDAGLSRYVRSIPSI